MTSSGKDKSKAVIIKEIEEEYEFRNKSKREKKLKSK